MKARRVLTVGALVLIAVAGLWVLLIGPWPVTYAPLDEEPGYQQTRAALEALEERTVPPARGRLSVGWGRVSITPRVPTYTAGYGIVRAHTIHDSISARALVIRSDTVRAVLIGIDALIVSREMSRRVSDRLHSSLGVPADHILFTATHTHSGPGCWDRSWLGQRFAGPFDEERLASLVDAMARAAELADATCAPAAMTFGSFRAARYVRNRLLKNHTDVDSLFTWAAFRHDDGTAAIWGTFPAHATAIGEEAGIISGDYPGVWEQSLEGREAEVALFSAGAVGSMGPRGEGRDVERARSIGLPLAEGVRVRLPLAEWRRDAAIIAFRVPVVPPGQQVRPEGLFGEGGNWKLSPILTRRLIPVRDTYVQVLCIGDLTIIGMPCDFSGQLASALRASAGNWASSFAVTSFNGDYIGYVVPDQYYGMNTYETRTMSWWGPHMGTFMTDVALRTLEHVSSLRDEGAYEPIGRANPPGAGTVAAGN